MGKYPEGKKMCPLLSIGAMASEEGGDTACREDDCAFWLDKECILTVALKRLAYGEK